MSDKVEIDGRRRPKVLVIGDAGQPTGFEKVVNGICSTLHHRRHFEVVVRGLGYNEEESVKEYPFEVKPAGNTLEDPFRIDKFPEWLEEDQPDVLLIVHDLWNQCHYLANKPPALPSVGYFPVDTPNMKWNYAVGVGAHSEVAVYTEFAAREMAASVREATDLMFRNAEPTQEARWVQLAREGLGINLRTDRLYRLQNPAQWTVIPHGIDRIFKPLPQAWCRRQFGIPDDAFVVLSVQANQFRKRQDLTFRAFKYLHDRQPNALLVLHCAGGDRMGWDLMQLAHFYGVEYATLCIHHHKPLLSDEELCWLYNCADAHINTGGGEGWGLSSIDSAQCGIPQLVPDWSATREIWKDAGILLPVSDYRMEPKFLNTAHAIIDPEAAGKALEALALSPELRHNFRADALARVCALPEWSEVGVRFEELLVKALTEGPPRPTTYSDIVAQREGEVFSEVRGRVTL